MSESFVNPIFGDRVHAETEIEGQRETETEIDVEIEGTGNLDVDAVVALLGGLDDLPVADHVAVFEQAHESLRRTLVGAGQDRRADPVASDRN